MIIYTKDAEFLESLIKSSEKTGAPVSGEKEGFYVSPFKMPPVIEQDMLDTKLRLII